MVGDGENLTLFVVENILWVVHELSLNSGSLEEFSAKFWLQFTTSSAVLFQGSS